MKKMSKTIVFFGSGPVAAKSLKSLAKEFDIEAVVTKPATVKEMENIARGIPIHSVRDKKALNELIASKSFKSPIGVLIDFGIIVSKHVINYFPLGIVNSHFSLLPEWRGADPITFAILSGQKKTGVSLMLIVEKLDEGPLLAQGSLQIDPDQTNPKLTEELINLSNKMLGEILPLYLENQVTPYEQPINEKPTYSRKLTKLDGVIDWSKPAAQIECEIRAFLEWPKSHTQLAGKDVIITKSRVVDLEGVPGNVVIKDKDIVVFCGKGALLIEQLKPAGKKEMTSEAFLAGHKHLF
jgi:methionyl-tRNA formyltransferase